MHSTEKFGLLITCHLVYKPIILYHLTGSFFFFLSVCSSSLLSFTFFLSFFLTPRLRVYLVSSLLPLIFGNSNYCIFVHNWKKGDFSEITFFYCTKEGKIFGKVWRPSSKTLLKKRLIQLFSEKALSTVQKHLLVKKLIEFLNINQFLLNNTELCKMS